MLKVKYESCNCIFFIIFATDFKRKETDFKKGKI